MANRPAKRPQASKRTPIPGKPDATPSRTARRRLLGSTKVNVEGLGRVEVRFRNADLEALEDDLDELLERVNTGRERRDELPFASIWDGLEEIIARWPMRTLRHLLAHGLAHLGYDDATLDELEPRVFNDQLTEALMGAIAIAFGADPDATADPPTAGD